jgi:hypothetical protein
MEKMWVAVSFMGVYCDDVGSLLSVWIAMWGYLTARVGPLDERAIC